MGYFFYQTLNKRNLVEPDLPRAVLNLFETFDLNGDGSLSTADLPPSSRMVLDTGEEEDFNLENCFCF